MGALGPFFKGPLSRGSKDMKLFRYGPPGDERPGMLDASGQRRDLGGIIGDFTASTLTPDALARLARIDPPGCRW